ncbi:MAG TPA: hypothetical protein V6D10_12650 [Trichocoleus sp.]|jgi:hypothetical protein
MTVIHLIEHATPWLSDTSLWQLSAGSDLSQTILGQLPFDLSIDPHLAQTFDTDVFKGTRTILNNFIKSGQVWALLIGLIVGYIIRGLTSYG